MAKKKKFIRRAVDKFTGKAKYDEAVEQYKRYFKKYTAARDDYAKRTEMLCDELRVHLKNINDCKEYIQMVQFRKLVDMLSLLKDVNVPDEFSQEKYKQQCRSIESIKQIKTRDALFTIDFDAHKVKTTLQAIFTAGFFTRHKAKESEDNVYKETKAVEEEMVKMNADLANLEACVAAARDAEHYLKKMSELFDKWLRYMQHAVHYIAYAAMRIYKRVAPKSISIALLHQDQRDELNATINLGKILSTLIRKQIVLKENENNLDTYRKEIKVEYDKYIVQEPA